MSHELTACLSWFHTGPGDAQRLLLCVLMFRMNPGNFTSSSSGRTKADVGNKIVLCGDTKYFPLLFRVRSYIYFLFLCRLRKDLKGLFVVHPAWYVRAVITVIKPFIRWARMIIRSANRTRCHIIIIRRFVLISKPLSLNRFSLACSEKFSRKMRFIHSLQELAEFVPVDQLQIPDCIREWVSTSHRIHFPELLPVIFSL